MNAKRKANKEAKKQANDEEYKIRGRGRRT